MRKSLLGRAGWSSVVPAAALVTVLATGAATAAQLVADAGVSPAGVVCERLRVVRHHRLVAQHCPPAPDEGAHLGAHLGAHDGAPGEAPGGTPHPPHRILRFPL
ncbi:hypothetical protein GCM10018790_56710 [Kitasatospora xanthocidica]|uniref:hypothetical protein n=1 Tax=Kitasatospora xanthocidica TaxID=83382 RepID=UPI001674274D|nr:hypothetical protein [Kitasatospora xanthocidica]GHF71491.1 hypothetical protein GCM10018790_56710 [Kitasatospora xanthocidica]